MKPEDLKIGFRIKHENGYIWEVKKMTKKAVTIESDGLKIDLFKTELLSLLQMGYYTSINQ